MDVFARGDDLVVKLELPGIDPEKDVSVEVREGMLFIAGERRHEKEIEEEAYYRMEASYGTFERQIAIRGSTRAASPRRTRTACSRWSCRRAR